MLSPKRTKFRKQHRGRMRGVASKGNTIAFGQFALQAQDCGWVTARQIEASRRAMTRYIKRGGQIWIRIFPDKPVTMRPAETRMGSGKGLSLIHISEPTRRRGISYAVFCLPQSDVQLPSHSLELGEQIDRMQ